MSSRASGARTHLTRRASWLAVVALTVAALVAPAAVAAHTPRVSLTCEDGLRVNLTQYNGNGTNSVAVAIDGAPVAGSPFTFSGSFSQTFAVEPPTRGPHGERRGHRLGRSERQPRLDPDVRAEHRRLRRADTDPDADARAADPDTNADAGG